MSTTSKVTSNCYYVPRTDRAYYDAIEKEDIPETADAPADKLQMVIHVENHDEALRFADQFGIVLRSHPKNVYLKASDVSSKLEPTDKVHYNVNVGNFVESLGDYFGLRPVAAGYVQKPCPAIVITFRTFEDSPSEVWEMEIALAKFLKGANVKRLVIVERNNTHIIKLSGWWGSTSKRTLRYNSDQFEYQVFEASTL